jgi:hypothetical protein
MSEPIVENPRYVFTASTGVPAVCGLRIVSDGAQRIVVLTELADNVGMSVTNAAAEIAAQVRSEFSLDPDLTRWIEHYPQYPTYDEITFTWDGHNALEPSWRRLVVEEAEVLIGDDGENV